MSAQNLLPLLEQLQLMENSLTNFMFETILKLRSLTDSKVFLLLESSETRRYCGSPELVHSFEQRGLHGRAADVRVELDTTAYVLKETTNGKRIRVDLEAEGGDAPVAEPAFASADESSTASGSKRRRVVESTGKTRPRGEAVKKEEEEPILALEGVPEYVIGEDDDDDDDNVEMAYDPWSPQEFAPSANHSPAENSLHHHSSSAFFAALPDPELEARKLDALLAIENPWAAYEKGSLENKLLKSVMYSVGKNIALSYPYGDLADKNSNVQSYFLQQCDHFMTQCSPLVVDKNQSHNRPPMSDDVDCLKGYTVGGFIRRCIRDGFKRVASSRKSKS